MCDILNKVAEIVNKGKIIKGFTPCFYVCVNLGKDRGGESHEHTQT